MFTLQVEIQRVLTNGVYIALTFALNRLFIESYTRWIKGPSRKLIIITNQKPSAITMIQTGKSGLFRDSPLVMKISRQINERISYFVLMSIREVKHNDHFSGCRYSFYE